MMTGRFPLHGSLALALSLTLAACGPTTGSHPASAGAKPVQAKPNAEGDNAPVVEALWKGEDLLTASAGMALTVRPLTDAEVGRAPGDLAQPVVAVVRDGTLHSYDDPEVARLAPGDKVVCIEDVEHSRKGTVDRKPDRSADRGPAATG